MKKVTRLLILTAFVFPLLTVTRAYAGGPGPGQRITTLERDRIGLDPLGAQHADPFNTDVRNDGWHPTESANNPLHLQDPIGDPRPDIDRDDLFHHSLLGDHDPFPNAGRPGWDNGNSGGGTAPIDGGISLLLAAGLGLGIKKARARKQNV